MELIKPITYQESHLISTTATETYATYNAATSYAIAARVTYLSRIYESLVASNVGNTPGIPASVTKWLDIGPDNRHAMFDNQVGTQTTKASPLTVVVQPLQVFGSAAVLNVEGTDVQVIINDGVGGTELYNETYSLDETIITDWYTYFFEPYSLKTDLIVSNLPLYANAAMTVIITGGGTVKVGSLVYGSSYKLGGTQYGASIGIRDFSVKETDDFGNTIFVQRAFSKRLDAEVYMDNSQLNFNYKLLSEIRAIPVVWIGADGSDYKPLVVFGYYRDFNITIKYPTYSLCSLTIEGLI